jgi:2-oxoglutarate ferredoxin oxidoreductase subunit beta
VRELQRYVAQALSTEGFSVVEAISYCHTTFGRQNKLGRATDMMRMLKEYSITRASAERMPESQLQGKIVRGVLVNRNVTEYTRLYDQVIEKAQAKVRQQNAPASS